MARLNRISSLLVLLLGAAVLTGCAHFESKPLDVAQTASDFDARTLDISELRAFVETNAGPVSVWPPTQWNFEQLALAAIFLHPSLDVARAELKSVRASKITAGARPNPTVGVMPEYNFTPESGASPWIAAIQFDIPIETAGKRGLRIARAEQLSEAAKLRLGTLAWEIRSGVRVALLDLADALKRAELLESQVVAQQCVLAALEIKFANGAANANDLAPTRIGLARSRSEITHERVRAEEARARLATAVGLPVKSLPPNTALLLDLSTDASLASNEARCRALTSRTDLLSALAEYAAAESALKLEIRKQYPDAHLGSGYQFDQGENKWALGLTVEVPVLNQNQGRIAEAAGKRREAGAHVLALQAKIAGDVDRALTAWRGAQSRVATLEDVRAAQQARVASLKAQFDAGAIESLDVLIAETELIADKLLQWEVQRQVQRAFGELEDALQRPLTFDLSANPRLAQP